MSFIAWSRLSMRTFHSLSTAWKNMPYVYLVFCQHRYETLTAVRSLCNKEVLFSWLFILVSSDQNFNLTILRRKSRTGVWSFSVKPNSAFYPLLFSRYVFFILLRVILWHIKFIYFIPNPELLILGCLPVSPAPTSSGSSTLREGWGWGCKFKLFCIIYVAFFKNLNFQKNTHCKGTKICRVI